MAVAGHHSESAIRHYWGAGKVHYRAWSDIMENNTINIYQYIARFQIIKESLSGISIFSRNHIVVKESKILFPKKSSMPSGTSFVTLVPEGHTALKSKSPIDPFELQFFQCVSPQERSQCEPNCQSSPRLL